VDPRPGCSVESAGHCPWAGKLCAMRRPRFGFRLGELFIASAAAATVLGGEALIDEQRAVCRTSASMDRIARPWTASRGGASATWIGAITPTLGSSPGIAPRATATASTVPSAPSGWRCTSLGSTTRTTSVSRALRPLDPGVRSGRGAERAPAARVSDRPVGSLWPSAARRAIMCRSWALQTTQRIPR
jgi:hypothetical protein